MPEERNEAEFVQHLREMCNVPRDLRAQWESWEPIREYVHTGALVRDTENTVTTNHILRIQHALVANLLPRDPQPILRMGEWAGMRELEDEAVARHITTHQTIASRQMDKAGLKRHLRGALQDALNVPAAWLKLRRVEDSSRDPIGAPLYDGGMQQQVREFRYLKGLYDADELLEGDPRIHELFELNRQLKDQLIESVAESFAEAPPALPTDVLGEPTGEPDPRLARIEDLRGDSLLTEEDLPPPLPVYRGYALESIDLEDMRFDWTVTRPEELEYVRWMAQRLWMPPSEIAKRFGLDPEEVKEMTKGRDDAQVALGTPDDLKVEETNRADMTVLEQTQKGGLYAVWEYWDRESGMVHVFVDGADRLLDSYRPEVTWSGFFPFFLLGPFDRVSGRFYGPSLTEQLRPLQEELNLLRTHSREHRRFSYPFWGIAKGILSDGEKQSLRARVPWGVVEFNKTENIKDSLFEFPTSVWNPALYFGNEARQDMEAISGAPSAVLGMTGTADLATDVALANQQFKVQTDNRKDLIMESVESLFQAVVEMNAAWLTTEHVTQMIGPDAEWLGSIQERQRVLTELRVLVDATPNGAAERQAEIAAWEKLANVILQLGLPANRLQIFLDILKRSGVATNISNFVDLAALAAPPPMPEGGEQGSQPATEEAPEAQGPRGEEGGRPDMASQEPEITPESVPNRPQIE